MHVGVHIIVRGIVQGVGFRYFAYDHAERLKLSGWVRNLENREVEIEAEGERGSIEIFLGELKIGPRSAHVKDLQIEWKPFENKYASFEIR